MFDVAVPTQDFVQVNHTGYYWARFPDPLWLYLIFKVSINCSHFTESRNNPQRCMTSEMIGFRFKSESFWLQWLLPTPLQLTFLESSLWFEGGVLSCCFLSFTPLTYYMYKVTRINTSFFYDNSSLFTQIAIRF